MPAIRGTYTSHPDTGVAGFWAQLTSGQLVGLARTAWPSVTGQNATQAKATLEAAFQPLFEVPAQISAPSLPAFHVRRGNVVYVQPSVITVEVVDTNPLVVNFTVSDGAMRQVKV